MKAYSWYIHWPLIIVLINKQLAIFKANQNHPNYKRLRTLYRFVIITEYCFKCGFVVYVSTAIAYLIRPLVIYALANEIVTILPLSSPFVDNKTTIGYTIEFIFHVCAVIFSGVSSACADFTFVMIIVNVLALAYIFNDSVEELNIAMNKEAPDTKVIKAYFRNLLLQHREITK